jgi:hypothetical protein
MAALPKIVEEMFSGVLVVFEFFPFYVGIVDGSCEQLCNAVNYPSTPLSTLPVVAARINMRRHKCGTPHEMNCLARIGGF